jgi:hypothetical protein
MSRWTVRNLGKKPKHTPHISAHGTWVRIDWPDRVEFGKTFLKNGSEYVRFHNRGVTSLASEVRRHCIVTERNP